MNPTKEQTAQWAREAGAVAHIGSTNLLFTVCLQDLHRLVLRAMAEQAKRDAKLCKSEEISAPEDNLEDTYNSGCFDCAAAILANAPKGQP